MQTLESVVGKPHLVTQHNSLVRAKYNYTHREIKVTRLLTSKVDPFQDYALGSGLVVEVEPKEVEAIFAAEGKKYNSVWRDFRETVANLNKKPIQIDTPNVEGDIYWTQSCVRDKKTGRYRVRLTEDITPLVAALKGGISPQYLLQYTVSLRVSTCVVFTKYCIVFGVCEGGSQGFLFGENSLNKLDGLAQYMAILKIESYWKGKDFFLKGHHYHLLLRK